MVQKKMRETITSQGFMLVEATAALFVIAIGIYGTIEMMQVGARTLHVTQEHTIAGRALQNEIETLRGLPFDTLELGYRREFASSTPELAMLMHVKTRVTVREHDGAGGSLVEVRVRLRWTTEHARRVERSVTTLIARKENQ